MPEENSFIGTSFESFEDAVEKAFADVKGDPAKEGLAFATVRRLWVEKGGVVGRIQYHVELESYRPSA